MTNLKRFTEILKKVIEDKSGATLGLGARDFLKIKNFKSGYQVGGYSEELKIPLKYGVYFQDIYNLSMGLLKVAKLETLQASYTPAIGLYLGLWVNNDILYIETSKRFTSKKEAIKEAQEREQLAIYDHRKKQSIYIK